MTFTITGRIVEDGVSATTINSQLFRQMFLCGAANLEANKAWINELNVFPVPDGDTGTNMTMTVISAVKEVTDLGETDNMRAICKAISSGSLRGARGNSGVILSQLFRGFCKIVRDHAEIDVPLCADAFDKAVETAYKAVMVPKEGTILTVAKGVAQKSRALVDEGVTDFADYIPQVLEEADKVLASTPDLLPVLKQAGVVDSGGEGLVQVLKGAYEGYQGKEVDVEALLHPAENAQAKEKEEEPSKPQYKFAYDTEYMIILDKPMNKKVGEDFRRFLTTYGEDIVIQTQPKAIKVHMRTNDPGMVIQKGLQYGPVRQMRLDNLNLKNDPVPVFNDPAEELKGSEAGQDKAKEETAAAVAWAAGNTQTASGTAAKPEYGSTDDDGANANVSSQGSSVDYSNTGEDSHTNAGDSSQAQESAAGVAGNGTAGMENADSGTRIVEEAEEDSVHKELGIIAVCAGEGLADIFKGLGVDRVISGGQTMNPSTADILDAVDKVNADTVFVLPNNKNIIMAANQAAIMDGDKKVIVIPTRSVPQGITAVINFMPDQDADANKVNMTEEITHVKSAEITYAVRDTTVDGVDIRQGNMMAIGDQGILGVGEDMNDTARAALDKMIDDSTELVSIYYGDGISEEAADSLREAVHNDHPNCEIDVQNGGQPVYYYILSAE